MKYEVLATADNGDGYVQSLGVYDNLDDIGIYTNMMAPNVKIMIVEVIEI